VTIHEIISDGVNFTDEKHASHNYSERARRNLWLQMSRMGAYDEHKEIPIMVRGEGTRVYDANGVDCSPTCWVTDVPTSPRPRRSR
jgi:hypothetical protein